MATLRNSQLEVLFNGEWHRIGASLDETALTLSPLNDGFVAGDDPAAVYGSEKRTVKIIKHEGNGLGISIQGGAENGRPIVIR